MATHRFVIFCSLQLAAASAEAQVPSAQPSSGKHHFGSRACITCYSEDVQTPLHCLLYLYVCFLGCVTAGSEIKCEPVRKFIVLLLRSTVSVLPR